MTSQIFSALAKGFSSKQIIDFLLREFPEHEKKISGAIKAGFTADQVLKFLSGGRKEVNQTEQNNMTEHEQVMGRDIKKREDVNDRALTAAAIAAGSIAAPMATAALQRVLPTAATALQRVLPTAATALKRALPTSLSSLTEDATSTLQQQKMQPTTSQPPVINLEQMQPVNTQAPNNITQPNKSIQAEIKPIDLNVFNTKYKGFADKIKNLKDSGNGEDQIADYFRSVAEPQTKKLEKEIGQPIENIIKQFMNQNTESEEKTSNLVPTEKINDVPTVENQLIPEAEAETEAEVEEVIEPIKMKKSDTVASLKGIGEIKEIRNGEALIEIDGKLHKVSEKELQAEPEEVKNSKIEFDISKIPETLRSSALNEIYATDNRSRITIKYNSGNQTKRYTFWRKEGQSIDESLIKKFINGSQLPISNGNSFWGAWNSKEADSRGTVAFHDLKNLAEPFQEGAGDPKKPYWVEEEKEIYYHPYMQAARQTLKEEEKKFNEENKKRKPKKKKVQKNLIG